MPARSRKRKVCFVTGTRAEWGLMRRVLAALRSHPRITLQIIATGMHLDRRRGYSLHQIRADGFRVDAVVPWASQSTDADATAHATGAAMADLARAFARLKTDIVLVVGDRVEAFAAAAAGHVSGRIVAHVHGGDRAVGVVDDSLRHAISKLAHVHFAATPGAAERLERLGEDRWRIHYVGSPGVEGIREEGAPANPAGLPAGSYALVVQHPSGGDDATERRRASMVLKAVRSTGFEQIVTIYPNNDPGSAGIIAAIESGRDELRVYRNCTRTDYLALLRDAAVLVGNSSSGIIEAASFGTPVIDIGDRQRGREHGNNVTHVPYVRSRIVEAIRAHAGRRSRGRRPSHNRYSRPNTSKRIAEILALLPLDGRTSGKLIAY